MRRLIAKLVIFLLLGAIINVAVAWGCVLGNEPALQSVQWEEQSGQPHRTNLVLVKPPRRTAVSVWHGTGLDEYRSHRMLEIPEMVSCGNIPEIEIPMWLDSVIEDGGIVETANDQRAVLLADNICQTKEELLYGIPCRALSLRCLRPELSSGTYADALFLDEWRGDAVERELRRYGWYCGARPLVFPRHPLWVGCAINTAFYSSLLWILFGLPFAIRRRLRISKGLCTTCAYPIGTSPTCTECGATVKPTR